MDKNNSRFSRPFLPAMARLVRVAREERGDFSLRLWLAGRLMGLLPTGTAARLRTRLYQVAGIKAGRGTLIAGPIQFGITGDPRRNLQIGARCFLNSPLFIDAAAPVTLGCGVSLGHHVVLVTTNHALGPAEFRAGSIETLPITIEDGAWVAANVTVLPGVTIGRGAVVAAGAVVTKDVVPNTLVGGIPAKLIRVLD